MFGVCGDPNQFGENRWLNNFNQYSQVYPSTFIICSAFANLNVVNKLGFLIRYNKTLYVLSSFTYQYHLDQYTYIYS